MEEEEGVTTWGGGGASEGEELGEEGTGAVEAGDNDVGVGLVERPKTVAGSEEEDVRRRVERAGSLGH